MSARLLDGVAIAQAIRGEVRPDADAFTREAGRQPGLALVLVGNDPASELYVGSKLKSAGESGIRADLERLPATANVDELLALVDRLNRSVIYDGILVQSPLPKAMGHDAERRVFDAIDPAKDVDGLTATNAGLLVSGRAGLVSCTPSGALMMVKQARGEDLTGPTSDRAEIRAAAEALFEEAQAEAARENG